MPLFSIIVPVYNSEKTLHKCLDSILCQTNPDFEVLMIENGSGDSSNAICREYAAMDTRFKLYACAENKGPSGARNLGLEQAKGEFITFIDSDDFVEPEYLESLRCAFQAADVVFFGYRQLSTDGKFLGEHIPNVLPDADYCETLLQLHKQDMFGYTWIKAFRRDIIGANRFSMELNLLEDEVFACEILAEERRVAVLAKPLYNYVTGNAGSLIGRTHPDYCRKVDAAYNAWRHLLRSFEGKDAALTQMANSHVNRCMYYGFERDVDVKEFFAALCCTEFFKNRSANNWFTDSVRTGAYYRLQNRKWLYRGKQYLSRYIRRRENL